MSILEMQHDPVLPAEFPIESPTIFFLTDEVRLTCKSGLTIRFPEVIIALIEGLNTQSETMIVWIRLSGLFTKKRTFRQSFLRCQVLSFPW